MQRVSLAALALASSALCHAQAFAAFGDYGDGANTDQVASYVNAQHPTYILSLGDQCYGASPPLSQQVGDKYSTWVNDDRMFPTLGNHEYEDACGGGSAKGYFNYFALPNNERYYDVVLGDVHVFSINSNTQEPDGTSKNSKQARWLKQKLAASASAWNIVIMHKPPFSSGHHGSTRYMQWPYEAWGADAVLSGHDHDYERLLYDANHDGTKMPYFVSGLGGQSKRAFATVLPASIKRYNAAFGVLLINATATTINFEFRNTAGTLIDSYSLTKTLNQNQVNARHVRTCC